MFKLESLEKERECSVTFVLVFHPSFRRSGSTFLGDMLVANSSSCLVYEPLIPLHEAFKGIEQMSHERKHF